jgi:multidrug efflux pump
MTSLAFILGVLPLAISTGAGAGARHSVGTGVMGGMIAATLLAVFHVPLFFKVLYDRRIRENRSHDELLDEVRHLHPIPQEGANDPPAPKAEKGDGHG